MLDLFLNYLVIQEKQYTFNFLLNIFLNKYEDIITLIYNCKQFSSPCPDTILTIKTPGFILQEKIYYYNEIQYCIFNKAGFFIEFDSTIKIYFEFFGIKIMLKEIKYF